MKKNNDFYCVDGYHLIISDMQNEKLPTKITLLEQILNFIFIPFLIFYKGMKK